MSSMPYPQPIPSYPFEPDPVTANPDFRVYNFRGDLPSYAEMLIPHRRDHYLLVFIRQAGQTRQWVDMAPYPLRDNTVYFSGPSQVVVKEEFKQLWSTGIAFTPAFLLNQSGAGLRQLPLIENRENGFELRLTEPDVALVEDMISKINAEYLRPGEWQQRMLGAYLNVLLTYLSRLYIAQYPGSGPSENTQLLKLFQAKVNECFTEWHEVGHYAGALHISAGHLSEVVKQQSGKPAIKHIHDRLVLEARRLLFHTPKPVKEISFDLGFADTSYFNRFFKRETGTTPAGYRAGIREMYH